MGCGRGGVESMASRERQNYSDYLNWEMFGNIFMSNKCCVFLEKKISSLGIRVPKERIIANGKTPL